jgi:xanthine dehydrogenase YagT iron-sulfur-binding subunit
MSGAPCDRKEIPESPDAEASSESEANEIRLSRRTFVQSAGVIAAGIATGVPRLVSAQAAHEAAGSAPQMVKVNLTINGEAHQANLDSRVTLLDLLREDLDLTGTKKGCDHGQCGACTVLLDGRRVNSCLTLGATCDGSQVTTIEGLAQGDTLHAVQAAFLEHDGFQCGYCTPGQICSATALLEEHKQGSLSQVSWEMGMRSGAGSGEAVQSPALSDDEIRERMSGNICRCGAYPNIVAAVRAAAGVGSARSGRNGASA